MAEYKTLVKKIPISPNKKTKQKNYQKKGLLAIIDQGQDLIGGYTNDAGMTVNCDLPVIVFGDHTRAVKYITFPFGAGADGIKVLQPKGCILPLYLYYGTQYVVAKMPNRGYTRHYQYVEKEDLPVPPLPEQERIVARIEELFSQLDAGVETLKKTKAQLAVYRQAVLKEAFSSCIEKKSIREMSSIVTSGSRGWAKYYSNSGAKFIRIGNLTRDKIEICLDDIQHVQLPDKTEGTRTKLEANDVLVSITADLGSIGFVPHDLGEAYVNQHIAMIRFNNPEQGQFYSSHWSVHRPDRRTHCIRSGRRSGAYSASLMAVSKPQSFAARIVMTAASCRVMVPEGLNSLSDIPFTMP